MIGRVQELLQAAGIRFTKKGKGRALIGFILSSDGKELPKVLVSFQNEHEVPFTDLVSARRRQIPFVLAVTHDSHQWYTDWGKPINAPVFLNEQSYTPTPALVLSRIFLHASDHLGKEGASPSLLPDAILACLLIRSFLHDTERSSDWIHVSSVGCLQNYYSEALRYYHISEFPLTLPEHAESVDWLVEQMQVLPPKGTELVKTYISFALERQRRDYFLHLTPDVISEAMVSAVESLHHTGGTAMSFTTGPDNLLYGLAQSERFSTVQAVTSDTYLFRLNQIYQAISGERKILQFQEHPLNLEIRNAYSLTALDLSRWSPDISTYTTWLKKAHSVTVTDGFIIAAIPSAILKQEAFLKVFSSPAFELEKTEPIEDTKLLGHVEDCHLIILRKHADQQAFHSTSHFPMTI